MNQTSRWKQRPPGSNWGDFGPDDQYGRMNLLTPEKVKQGIAEVKEGLTFNLSLPLDFPGGNVLNPRRLPPVLRPTVRNGKPNLNYQLWCDEIKTHIQYQSAIEAKQADHRKTSYFFLGANFPDT